MPIITSEHFTTCSYSLALQGGGGLTYLKIDGVFFAYGIVIQGALRCLIPIVIIILAVKLGLMVGTFGQSVQISCHTIFKSLLPSCAEIGIWTHPALYAARGIY